MYKLTLIYLQNNTYVYTSNSIEKDTNLFFCHLYISQLYTSIIDLQNKYLYWDSNKCVAEEPWLLVQEEPLPLDAESAKLINEIYDRITILQKRGLSIRTIREALLSYQTPSRIRITSDMRILLTDYNDLELKFTPLCKTIYLFYLSHPEGIAFKQLTDHKEELLTIYQKCSPKNNPEQLLKHIENLTNPLHNSINEKTSIIQRDIAKVLDENLLSFYIIDGEKGSKHRIRQATDTTFEQQTPPDINHQSCTIELISSQNNHTQLGNS